MRSINRLTDRTVKTLSWPGRHSDGAGLYLEVRDSGTRSWLFMAKAGGRQKWLGLGRYPDTPLGLAREKAAAARRMMAEGGDPFAEARKVREPTFGECVDLFLDDQRKAAWKSAPHKRAWEMTLSDVYCRHIRPMQVSQIGTSDILLTLKPIWMAKPSTAMRLRGRIERVLSFAKMHGWRDENRTNPAQWRGHLDQLLTAPKKLRQVRHHDAMPYDSIPAFVAQLRTVNTLSARALEFLILVAGRASEVTGARWDESDLVGGIWRIPGSRMKNGLPHEVVLSSRALVILQELAEIRCNEFVFPGQHGRKLPLTTNALEMLMRRMKAKPFTIHGFRSGFRDWAGNETHHAREVAEEALSHQIGNVVERSYRRGAAIEKRRRLMQDWCDFVEGMEAKVIPLRAS